MTLAELVSQVEKNIGRDDLTDDIPAYINLALERIQTDHPSFLDWQRTAYRHVKGDEEPIWRLKLPEDLGRLFHVQFTNSKYGALERLPRKEFDKNFPEIYTKPKRGTPEYYTRWSNCIEVYPIPKKGKTYFIRYARSPITLVRDEDKPLLRYDNVIIECATMIAYNRIGMPEEGGRQNQIYHSYLEAAVRKESAVDGDTSYSLKPFSSSSPVHMERNVVRRSDFNV